MVRRRPHFEPLPSFLVTKTVSNQRGVRERRASGRVKSNRLSLTAVRASLSAHWHAHALPMENAARCRFNQTRTNPRPFVSDYVDLFLTRIPALLRSVRSLVRLQPLPRPNQATVNVMQHPVRAQDPVLCHPSTLSHCLPSAPPPCAAGPSAALPPRQPLHGA